MLRYFIVVFYISLVGTVHSVRIDKHESNEIISTTELNRKKVFFGYTLPTPTSEPSTTTEMVCQDQSSMCCFWATAGECDKNLFWMRLHCPVTCGTCSCKGPHADKCKSIGVRCATTTPLTTTTTAPPTTTTVKPTMPLTSPTPTVTRIKKIRPYTPPPNGFARTRRTIAPLTTRPRLVTFETSKKTTSTMKATTPSTTTRSTMRTTITTTESPFACKDFNRLCSFWLKYGECQINNHWMAENCQLSCGTCSDILEKRRMPMNMKRCVDIHASCDYWSSRGECERNVNWMSRKCPKSCRFCVPPKA